ncbi:unnamed protein product [Arctogadus glacialis]
MPRPRCWPMESNVITGGHLTTSLSILSAYRLPNPRPPDLPPVEPLPACPLPTSWSTRSSWVNVRKGISYGNPGGFDVLLSSRSRLDVSGDLTFLRRVPRNTDKLTVAEVLTLGPRQRVGVALL